MTLVHGPYAQANDYIHEELLANACEEISAEYIMTSKTKVYELDITITYPIEILPERKNRPD